MAKKKKQRSIPFRDADPVEPQTPLQRRQAELLAEIRRLNDKKSHLRVAWYASSDAQERQRLLGAAAEIKLRIKVLEVQIRKLRKPKPNKVRPDRPAGGVSDYRGAKFAAVTWAKPLRG